MSQKKSPPGPRTMAGTLGDFRPSGTPVSRFAVIDAARGVALLAMFAYHLSFDLNYFGAIHQNFNFDPFWLTARTLILGSFLLLVGVSLVLATQQGIRWPSFLRRLGRVAGCALLVSIGSYLMFPHSWIYFGVLHHIALASLLGLAFLRLDWMNLPLGLGLIALGTVLKLSAFDAPALQWIGLMTHKPITEDYVPLLPWFGAVLLGMFAGRRFVQWDTLGAARNWAPFGRATWLLTLAGRHTLLLYMLHQPIFIGVLYVVLGQ